MKKIFILLLLVVLSFPLTACNTVKIADYKDEVDTLEFTTKYKEKYLELHSKLSEKDFIYKDIYKVISFDKNKENENTKLKSTFKQDLSTKIFEYNSSGYQSNQRTNFEKVKVKDKVLYYFQDDNFFMKDKFGEISEYQYETTFLINSCCRMLFVSDVFDYGSANYKCYIDDNIYTQFLSGDIYDMNVVQIKQTIFEDDKVTFYMQELRTGDGFSFALNLSMIFDFKDVELKL